MYDPNNIFAKVLRGDIVCQNVHESDHALAFENIAPKAPIHVLVIPKGSYRNLSEFTSAASFEEIQGFWTAVNHVTHKLDLVKTGYRVITNEGLNAHQEVFHFHVHILGGKSLGPLVS